MTVNGEVLSYDSHDGILEGSSRTFEPDVSGSTPVLTHASETITPSPIAEYTIDGQTLVAGGSPITVDGTVLSLAPSASAIVVGSKTEDLGVVASQDIGGMINSVLEAGNGPTATASGSEAVSGEGSALQPLGFWSVGTAISMVLLVAWL